MKGKQAKRKADDNAPAYLVEQEDSSVVLKGHSELSITEQIRRHYASN
ncbi:hypothetical protein GCM10009114_10050 [Aliiglaciecola litoralis]|uniref:Uncharacterized protein n=1 Tax=Aliiglaciecola litoralis TaxID=582857 RepID=A0ABP3WPG3_9ALTE